MKFEKESARRVRRVLRSMLALSEFQFFANLTLRMPIKPDPSRETVAADGRNIFYNPDWAAKASNDLIREKLCGAVLACGLKHHTRRGARDYQRWQQASHLVRLPLLQDAGVIDADAAQGGLKMSIEAAYAQLPEPPESDGGGAGDEGDDGQDGPPSFDHGMGEVMDSPTLKEEQRDGAGGADGGDGGADGGDGGTGDDGGDDQEGAGAATTDPVQAEEQEWDEVMQQAAQWSKAQGSMPGGVQEVIDAAHVSEIDWRTELRRFMQDHAPLDYTWSRPNRRFIDDGIYLPSMDGESMETLVFVIDTSASMNPVELGVSWTEVRGGAQDVEPERVLVIQCDESVTHTAEYHHTELPEKLDAVGRGGTRFQPAFEWVDRELQQKPACLIYFTDLQPWDEYPEEPNYPVLWICTDRHAEDPAFGERINMEVTP